MNLGFFGVQFSFGLTQSAVNPIFLFLGAEAHSLPILNIAGPITGLLIQPFIGAMSDKTWSDRWGRRKPYILGGSLVMIIILFLFPLVTALWMAVICLWLVDAGNNTAMEPYRALISDRLRKTQIPKGFLIQSMFTGAGAVLANISLFVFQKIFPGSAEGAVPTWVFVVFWFGAVCAIVTVGLAMLRTKEITPTDEELTHIRSQSKSPGATISEIAEAVKVMPIGMHKIGLAFLFQWYAMFIYWQFVSVSVAESVWNAAPGTPGYEEAAGWVGLMNGTYNFVTMLSALAQLPLCHRYGGKRVHAGTLALAGLSLAWLSTINNQYLTLVPMIGLGICWASMVGVPYLMVASMVPRERTGVYMGILNMMIVVSDADPDAHLRLDLREPPGQQRHQRDLARRSPARLRRCGHALGQHTPRRRRVPGHAAQRTSRDHRLRSGRGRLGRVALRAVCREPGPRDRSRGRSSHRGGGSLRTGQRTGRHRARSRSRRPQTAVRPERGAGRHAPDRDAP